jgi:predicted nucleic acid-binding protein
MNVVDSSAWLEYFADGPNAAFFAKPIEQPDELLVPSLTLYEVFNACYSNETREARSAPLPSCSRARWSISTPVSP